jgi:PIN domain nuclease of toxin-antitoxin system
VRVLLDAHALLWWVTSSGSRLSPRAQAIIGDGRTDALVGAGVLYEIAIKAGIGRLELPAPGESYLPRLLRKHAFGVLPIDENHSLRAGGLPLIHRDPWDRLLIAQSQIEDVPILTADPVIGQYDVEVIW